MPYDRKESDRRYREKNKEKIKESNRKYEKENKEKRKEYRETNKEKIKEYQKISPVYYKYRSIYHWKSRGIIDDDYDALFEVYVKETHCWICGKEYVKRNHRHLDHDHDTGEPRYICCASCNSKLK